MLLGQTTRFLLNGVVATGVHFLVLELLLRTTGYRYAGWCNLVAAAVGCTASFVGNRYYVFRSTAAPVPQQFARFWLLYATLAGLHGIWMYLTTDLAGFDYRASFVVATLLQAACSFHGGRRWVFRAQS